MEEDLKMRINKQKIKIMVCSRNGVDRTMIQLKYKIIQKMEGFSYLSNKIIT